MITTQESTSIQELITNAKTIYIALAATANYDTVASALALYLSFKEAGKNALIMSSSPMRVEFSYLIGVNEIQSVVGNRNLVVSFAYDQQNVDKVSYHISEDGQRFNLVIAPTDGGRPLDPSTVEYRYEGASADLVFIVGASQFDDLGALYTQEPYFFDGADSVSITTFQAQPFARRMFETTGQSCMAEGVAVLLEGLGMEPKDDVATNILSSIEQATDRFQSLGVGPDLFELVARLIRNGARRSASNPVIHGQPQVSPNAIPPMGRVPQDEIIQEIPQQMPIPIYSSMPPATPASTSSFAEALKKKSGQMQVPVQTQVQQQFQQPPQQPQLPQQLYQQYAQPVQPAQPVQSTQPVQQTQAENMKINQLKRTNGVAQSHQFQQSQNPPPDWLQPKVYTGTSKV